MNRWDETNIEKMFREELENRGFVLGRDFAAQFPIKNSFILDFAFPKQKIAIECDGDFYHSKPEARKRDGFKTYILMKRGWKVFRFLGSEISNDVKSCVDTVCEYL